MAIIKVITTTNAGKDVVEKKRIIGQ
jgi:hypothetical protein